MNATMKKFGYPGTLIQEYQHWVVLLRPQQATLGALVLICKDDVESFAEVSSAAFAELKEVTKAIEQHLKSCFNYDKINYLMLMMVDRDVHFHVLPRYAETRLIDHTEFIDSGWPGPPDLSQTNRTGETQNERILQTIKEGFGMNMR